MLFVISLLVTPAAYASAVRQAVAFCLESIIPSLFLFMVASNLCIAYDMLAPLYKPLSRFMRFFKLPPQAVQAFILGNIAGFPMGAKVASQLYTQGKISKNDAEHLLGFCNNCSPAFLIGAIGLSIWGSTSAGALLWGVELISSLIAGKIICRKAGRGRMVRAAQANTPVSFSAAFTSAVKNAATAMLYICAFIVFMSSFTVILSFGGLSEHFGQFEGLFLGVFEITAGIRTLQSLTPLSFACACAVCGFGGLSVACQALLFAESANLSVKKYFLGKALTGAFAFLLGFCIYSALSNSAPAFAQSIPAFGGFGLSNGFFAVNAVVALFFTLLLAILSFCAVPKSKK